MWLNVTWYVLFVAIIAGYLVLDGFDIGVGILHPFVAKTDEERRLSLNSIGPIWDGNEVWLVIGGGVLFAAFPIVYASLFSGFYGAMMLVLLSLILRTVAIEFRGQRVSATWRTVWDSIFAIASAGLAVLLGVAFGNIVQGVPIDQQGYITIGSLFDLLHPFALLIGATTVVMLALHGALYLNLKTEGDLQARTRRLVPRLMAGFVVMAAVIIVMMIASRHPISAIYTQIWPLIFPVGVVAALAGAWLAWRRAREFVAFLCSAAMIALVIFSVGVGLYPNLLISTTNPEYNLTAFNAASAPNALMIMFVVALIGIPLIVLYTAGVYYIFRGKVRLSPHSY